jgi:hypothetical protein
MRGNMFMSTIPSVLGTLPLSLLQLDYNQLTGAVPTTLTARFTPTYFGFLGNCITGTGNQPMGCAMAERAGGISPMRDVCSGGVCLSHECLRLRLCVRVHVRVRVCGGACV